MLTLIVFGFVAITSISVLILRLWVQQTVVQCSNKVSLKGKTVLITGATAGIGQATALGIARRGARVIIGACNLKKGRVAVEYLQKASGNNNISIKLLELSSLKSVKKFAEEIIKEEERLDVLINNAGILDLLKKSGPSRIICLSSAAHSVGQLDLDDADFHKKDYHWSSHYSHTKLAIVLFARELSKRLVGTEVTVNAVHPGSCGSELFLAQGNLFFKVFHAIGPVWWRTPEQGAQTSIYLATSDDVMGVSGKYFVDSVAAQPSQAAQDDDKACKLWQISERLTAA